MQTTATHSKSGGGPADSKPPLRSHVATAIAPDLKTTPAFESAADIESKTGITVGHAALLGNTLDAPSIVAPAAVTATPAPSLIPPASVIRARLESIEKERTMLKKLLKLAEEQEGVGE